MSGTLLERCWYVVEMLLERCCDCCDVDGTLLGTKTHPETFHEGSSFWTRTVSLFLEKNNVLGLNKNVFLCLSKNNFSFSQNTYLVCYIFKYSYTHFHVAIWPVLPCVTRYMFTYIGLYNDCVCLASFKSPYKRTPCVRFGYSIC